jgi:hypothetical protein
MKHAIYYLPFLLLFFALGCEEDGSGTVDPPMEEMEPEPTSLRTGLLFHVPFSGNADDIGVNGLTGVVTGATITEDRHGKANEAYRFDGVNDFISYGPAPSLSLGGRATYTFTAWVKLEEQADPQRQYAISKFNGGVNAGWYLGVNAERRVQTYRNLPPWSTAGSPTFNWDEYTHIAATYDGVDLSVWKNGELDRTILFGSNNNDNTTEVLIGGVFSNNEVLPTLKGVIDNVRIYNRVLTPEELTWLATH